MENSISPFFVDLYKSMETHPTQFEDYEVWDGYCYSKGNFYETSTLIGGHGGIQKTTTKVCTAFTWLGVKKDVQHLVHECQVCQ